MDVSQLAQDLKVQCSKKPERWYKTVGPNENYRVKHDYFELPHPKYLFNFVDNVALNGSDRDGLTIMCMAAFFGEPKICELFASLGTTATREDKDNRNALHFAAIGRVSSENAKKLIDVILAWDPNGCQAVLRNKASVARLLELAKDSENYQFYLEISKMVKISYSSPLASMKSQHDSGIPEDYRHNEPGYVAHHSDLPDINNKAIPTLTQMCMSVAKLQALTNVNFRKKMKTLLPVTCLQLFVDCLPVDEFSPRLLDFFSSCPGVVVDAKQWYWSIYERERIFRNAYQVRSYNRFTNLISVYDNLPKFQHPPKDKYDSPNSAIRIFENYRPFSGSPVVPFDTFKQKFTKFTHNIFDEFNWANALVIGGAVLGSIMPSAGGPNPFRESDIDLCFYNLSDKDFAQRVLSFIDFLKSKFGYVLVLDTRECFVLCIKAPIRRIQIMKGNWRSIEQILMHVDIDCTGLGYNGTQVFAAPRAVLALNRCWSVVTQMHYAVRGTRTYEQRLVKYAHRGFTIVDFNCPVKKYDISQHLELYVKDGQTLQPYMHYSHPFGLLLLLLIESLSGKVDYDFWARGEEQADLPKVSKFWTPQKIRAEIEKGKVTYFSYGERQTYYRSLYTPLYLNSKNSTENVFDRSDMESRHWVHGRMYDGLADQMT